MAKSLFALSVPVMLTIVSIFPTNANAQISGWGWWGFSVLRAEIRTDKTPPPQKVSTILVVQTPTAADATIEIACANPGNQGVPNQAVAFNRELAGASQITPSDIVDREKGNKANTTVNLVLDSFEVDANCLNAGLTGWTAIEGSAMVTAIKAQVTWYFCTGEDLNLDGDPDPCLDETSDGQTVLTIDLTNPLDSETAICTLNKKLYPRSPDGEANHQAFLDCNSPTVTKPGKK
jgi:hypothetical protein